jgi:hypothetical protein
MRKLYLLTCTNFTQNCKIEKLMTIFSGRDQLADQDSDGNQSGVNLINAFSSFSLSMTKLNLKKWNLKIFSAFK